MKIFLVNICILQINLWNKFFFLTWANLQWCCIGTYFKTCSHSTYQLISVHDSWLLLQLVMAWTCLTLPGCFRIGANNLIGASLSKPHTGGSLSWFRTLHVQTVRTIKYDWEAIQVCLSWFRKSHVQTVRTIKSNWEAIQVCYGFVCRVYRLWER